MTARDTKPSRLREAALFDIDDMLDHYFAQAPQAPQMVHKLEVAILEARQHIEKFPGTGSPRYESSKSDEVLRFWLLKRFPYARFYFERTGYIDIVRLIHQAADIPTHIQP